MGSYIARRLLALVPILIGVTMVAFLVSRGLPGDPARLYAGMQASDFEVQAIRESLGLNKPLYHQYWIYMQGLIQGDLGFSLRTGFPVAEDIRNRLPATVEMVIFALAFALAIALPLGVWAAVRRGKLIDRFSKVHLHPGGGHPRLLGGPHTGVDLLRFS